MRYVLMFVVVLVIFSGCKIGKSDYNSYEEEIDLSLVNKYVFTFSSETGEFIIEDSEDIKKINDFLGYSNMITYETDTMAACAAYGSVEIYLEPNRILNFEIYTHDENSFTFDNTEYGDPNIVTYINYENKNLDELIELVKSCE